MKIVAVCGSGLGSSFMLEMNINDVLKKLGVKNVEVDHSDLGSFTRDMADYIVCGRDIAMAMESYNNLIVLDSILSKQELTEKISKVLKDNNLL